MSFTKLIAVLAFCLVTSSAHAAVTGYVCMATNTPPENAPTRGSSGSMTIVLYSGAACTGSLLVVKYFCSVNATSNLCSNTAKPTANGLGMLFGLAERAMDSAKQVTLGTNECIGGNDGCAATLELRAD